MGLTLKLTSVRTGLDLSEQAACVGSDPMEQDLL